VNHQLNLEKNLTGGLAPNRLARIPERGIL
jgi:hypothetical protein